MSNALQIMKKFMNSLDNTALSGREALDEAVQACSKFGSMQAVINSLVQGCASASDKTAWLQAACGINLTNADTGAITGSDAGVGATKTATSVVPEGNLERKYSNSTVYTKSDWQGLQVTQPANFNEAQRHVLSGIYTWWMSEGLNLIKESYGLSFDEAGTTVKKLTIAFDDPSGGWGNALALINSHEENGQTTALTLRVNMAYFSNISASDRDGKQGGNYLDRTLAHELTHAVMAANIDNFIELPRFIKEGAAELVHGIDDTRGNTIRQLLQNPTALQAALDVDNATGSTSITYSSDVNAAGYMLLRYLAKQGASGGTGTIQPPVSKWPGSQVTYSSDYSTVNVGTGFSGVVWLNPSSGVTYAGETNTINASGATGSLTLIGRGTQNAYIIGGSGANDMWGGGASNDVMQGGSGRNVFWYGGGDGTDTVTGFHSGVDKINYYAGGMDSITTEGASVVIASGQGSLTIRDAAAKRLDILVGSTNFRCWFGRSDQDNIVTTSADINFYDGAANRVDTLKVADASAVINLQSTQGIWYAGIDVVDAAAATGSTVIVGDRSANTLIGGKGTTAMWGGGAASDVMQGGSGTDTFWYGHGDGQDTIVSGMAGDSIYFYNVGSGQASFSMDGSNLKLALGGNDTLTVTNWTAASGVNTFRFADQSEYTLTSSLTAIRTK